MAGYEWTAVLLKPNDLVVRSAAEFKAAERRKLTIRVLSRQERSEQGDREFGLNQPAVAATLFEKDRPALAMAFGSTNPQKVLQY